MSTARAGIAVILLMDALALWTFCELGGGGSASFGPMVDTSADRLLLQLWPGVIFVVMLSARQATFSAGPSSPGSRIRRCR